MYEPAIIIILRRALLPVAAPARHPIVLGRAVHRPLPRRALAQLMHTNPRALAPARDQRASLPARHPRDVAQLGDGPPPLPRVAVLHAGVEEAHGGVHEGGAVEGVERDGGAEGLDAGVDAADGVGPGGGGGGGEAGGDHGGGGHGGVDPRGDDAPGVVEGPDAGDVVGAVVEGWAEGGGQRGHVFGGEGGEGGAQGFFEGVEGAGDFQPFGFGGEGGGLEVGL